MKKIVAANLQRKDCSVRLGGPQEEVRIQKVYTKTTRNWKSYGPGV